MAEKKSPDCKACNKPISAEKQSYIISQQGDRVCRKCGDEIMKNENAKTPGKIKIVDLEGGGKALVMTKK